MCSGFVGYRCLSCFARGSRQVPRCGGCSSGLESVDKERIVQMGDVVDYDYGNKRHWRRWVWNRIDERASAARGGIILFLAGQEAFDLNVARGKGFSQRNMIAIERDPRTLAHLRSMGILTIEGDLLEVLQSWPQHVSVTAVLADLCHGLKMRVYERALDPIWTNPAFNDCVWGFNFLRGRESEPDANKIRLGIAGESFIKHRGEIFFAAVMGYPQLGFATQTKESMAFRAAFEIAGVFARDAAWPSFAQYRNVEKKQTFDSVVFRGPLALADEFCRQDLRSVLNMKIEASNVLGERLRAPLAARQAQRRKISAVLAHHTRRQPGWAA